MNLKRAVVFGAGNIGRGFIGQTFSRSGYHVTFIDVFPPVVDALNRQGHYPVQIVSDDLDETVSVGPVDALLASDTEGVASAIAAADLMATAVGVNAIKSIAPLIAAGLMQRKASGREEPLDTIVCENKIDADDYLRELVKANIPVQDQAWLDEHAGFVEASIGRMVPVMPESLRQANPLLVQVEPYHELPVDADGFAGPIPDLIAIKPFAPFDFYIKRKLYVHNLGHAITAYLGRLKRCRTIAGAIQDNQIRPVVRQAMLESCLALSRFYQVPMADLTGHVDDLLRRFANRKLGDTVLRVGKDPMRKLSVDDRLAGALHFDLQQAVLPQATAVGLAAGLLFTPDDDPAAQEMLAMIRQHGPEAFLAEHAGLSGTAELDSWRGQVLMLYRALRFGRG